MSSTADDVLKSRELTAEELESWRRRSNVQELELKDRLRAELEASKGAEAKVTETWRKVLRLAKVRLDPVLSAEPALLQALPPPPAHLPCPPTHSPLCR